MVNWFIIIILAVAVFLMFKVSHVKHSKKKFFAILIILLAFFFLASFYFISTRNNVDLTTTSGLGTGMKLYGGWLASSFYNIKSLVGYAGKLNWTDVNGSFFNKTSSDNPNESSEPVKISIADTGSYIVNNTIKKIKPNVPKPISSP